MKLPFFFILLTFSSIIYGAKLTSVNNSGNFLQVKLNERENLALIIGSPVWIETNNKTLKTKGYIIHKAGRSAWIELSAKIPKMQPGQLMSIVQRQTSLKSIIKDPETPYSPDSTLCYALSCFPKLRSPIHQSRVQLLRKRQHREQGDNQGNYRLTGFTWSWSSVFSDSRWIQLLKIGLERSTLKGPAKLTSRNGDMTEKKDHLSLEGRWPIPGNFLITTSLNFLSRTIGGSSVVKPAHFFAWTEPKLFLSKKFLKESEAGVFLSGPVNLKSQQDDEIIRVQKGTWLGVYGLHRIHSKSVISGKIVLEPWNSKLSSEQNSWKNSFHFWLSGDRYFTDSIQVELSLFHNRQRFYSADSGLDETKLAKTGLVIQVQKYRTNFGRIGMAIEVESGDFSENDQQGQTIQLSQVNTLVAIEYGFKF